MIVAFRVDASVQIGSGHVIRCLTLAEQLRCLGAEVLFICRELPGNLNGLIVERGFELRRMPLSHTPAAEFDWNRHAAWLAVPWQQDATETRVELKTLPSSIDWLVVDHYALDRSWETMLRSVVDKIMIIDDLADRPHDCDLLLDQNLYVDQETRYDGLVPLGCQQLLGPGFALLRSEFAAVRKTLVARSGEVRRILVFMGGSDQDNVTGRVLDALDGLTSKDLSIDLIIGAQSSHRTMLKSRCEAMPNVNVHENVADMASLMGLVDLAVGGGGTTTWERCALCLPAVIISLAENQTPIAQAVAEQGAVIYLGEQRDVNAQMIGLELVRLLADPTQLRQLGERAGRLVDAGGLHRVVKKLLGIS